MNLSGFLTAYLLRPVRACALLMLIIVGLITLGIAFPVLSVSARERVMQRWSQALIYIVGIRLRIVGQPPCAAALVVANHVSWADPFVLIAGSPVHFVAKAEIRSWPVFGWLAAQAGTIFIQRERARDVHKVTQNFTAALQSGRAVGMFPESTTTNGKQLLPFKPPLFQVALDANVICQPVALRYEHDAAVWIDNMGFLSSIWRIMAVPQIPVVATYCVPVVPNSQMHRRDLAVASEAAIAAVLNLSAPHIDEI
ncbi:lysophospholipid acyltransferase family protein [Sulfuriferula nivalis]|uniref:1-acyl-sn-glycerol-3-phosphate acyltransferase n=1 Tax=Sulfuriferula nivalis TaxID=2675298 RepID=A0A809RKY2_9PROT|nr:lysophospholipid acyltransferase family protein [Sulfuriferula nivalis]BBP02115.1 1-acyl-sn-glycerol-3-phosphate acyltransferase [Sulfuriferula nivalis]